MTTLPHHTDKKLGLVIDLDICVGCHACAVSCKEWNTGAYGAPLSDLHAYGADPSGTWLNRIHSYEVKPKEGPAQLIHFPRSCLHCEDAPCVTVCPTGASYKRTEDGIVLEVCPGSNVALGIFPSFAAHPLAKLRDAGVKVTVSTDDPPFFHTSMTREYEELSRAYRWDEADFAELNQTALAAAFCDDATRDKIKARLEAS